MMNSGLFNSIATVLGFITFVGIVYWAWSDRKKQDFEEAANIPFMEDEAPGDADKPRH